MSLELPQSRDFLFVQTFTTVNYQIGGFAAATWALFSVIQIHNRLSPPETHVDNCIEQMGLRVLQLNFVGLKTFQACVCVCLCVSVCLYVSVKHWTQFVNYSSDQLQETNTSHFGRLHRHSVKNLTRDMITRKRHREGPDKHVNQTLCSTSSLMNSCCS